jgi:very-short-patch-repair endonuclease
MRSNILTHKRARALTPPEVRLWARLKSKPAGWPTWRPQHPLGPYVLDFYCAAAKLCVELDGSTHDQPDALAHDQRRDAWLAAQGVTVLRFPALDALRDPDTLADHVWTVCFKRLGRSPPP